MLKGNLIRRTLATGIVTTVAVFPAAAQARFDLNPSPGTPAPVQTVSSPAAPQPTLGDQSGFDWGDAGIGAAGRARPARRRRGGNGRCVATPASPARRRVS